MDKQYPVTPEENVAWYANLNVVFAISLLVSDLSVSYSDPTAKQPSPDGDILSNLETMPWFGYFRNATSVFTQLQFNEGSLMGCHALCGLVRDL